MEKEETSGAQTRQTAVDSPHWFVLKASRREIHAIEILDRAGIRTYYPTVATDRTVRDRKIIIRRALIPNTLFAYAPFRQINNIKNTHSFITYSYRKEGGQYKILQVPEAEMERFIDAAGRMNEDITYFQPAEVELKKGDRVRIVGGVFDGHEGVLLRAKGRAKRMFLIDFDLLGAIGTHIAPEYIQLIDQPAHKTGRR